MPPANTTFGTATELGSLPATTSQNDINDAGVNYTVFFKFTAPAGVVQVWAWIKSTRVGAGYRPSVTPYDQAQVEILSENSHIPTDVPNRPILFPVTPGQVHYLQVVKNTDTAGPEEISVQVKTTPNESTIPFEAIVVNGDELGQPVGLFSPSTDYRTIKFYKNVAIGEGGCITKNGKTLFDNRIFADRKIKLYDTNFNELGNDTILAFAWIRFNRTTNKFWVLVTENAAFAKLYRVDPETLPLSKTLVATFADGFGNQCAISTNPAETIAYYSRQTFGDPIRRWDLSLDVAMANFVAAPTVNHTTLDTLCLENGNVVVSWSDHTNNAVSCRVYTSAGALVSQADFDSFEENYGGARLAYAPDSPTSYWVKLRGIIGTGGAGTPSGYGIFKRITAATGVVTATVTHTEFSGRNWIGPEGVTPNGESGFWNSCPFVVWQIGTPPPSGIYTVTPGARNDAGLAIPTPTFKTALMP